MPDTKAETIIKALVTALEAEDIEVKRNSAVPETVPAEGLAIVRDGDPGAPEQALGFSNAYYRHEIEIEIYVRGAKASVRDSAFDALIQKLGAALGNDETLGGLVYGMTYGRPNTSIEAVEGDTDIKAATLTVALEYETATPLS